MLKQMISLIRPNQWIKNVFVLMPLFFGGQLLSSWCWKESIIAFAAFSLMASAIYCLNDLFDLESDRKHPEKCLRPLASGELKKSHALFLIAFLIPSSLALSYFLLGTGALAVTLILTFYLLINIAYSYRLKHIAIIDVFIVSLGFVLRLLAGGLSCAITLSPWIVLMTFLLALFLAFAKRRDDVVLYENNRVEIRKSVSSYNLPFMNQTLGILAAVTIVCYIMYTVSPEVEARFGNSYVYVTSIFVIAAILRYLQLALVEHKTGNPVNVVFRDRFVQICLLGWLATFSVILYL